ncbi:MAG: hypothetical protein AB1489_31695, partial [Acidobacteriota bacterium]
KKNISNYGANPTFKKEFLDPFFNAITDIGKGEKLLLGWLPGGNLEVSINGTSRAKFKNVSFAQAVWLCYLQP